MFPRGGREEGRLVRNDDEEHERRQRRPRPPELPPPFAFRVRGMGQFGSGGMRQLERIVPVMMEEIFITGNRSHPYDRKPRDDFPVPLKCPTCQFSFKYIPFDSRETPPMNLENRFSHNGRACFQSGNCPICFEDAGPPMVNLMCGHWICVDCFKQLGGKSGLDAEKSIEVAGREEYEAYRARMREEHGVGSDDDDDNDVGEAVPMPEEALGVLMQIIQNQFPRDDEDDEEEDDEEEESDGEEEEEEEEDSGEDFGVYFDEHFHDEEEEEDTDDDMLREEYLGIDPAHYASRRREERVRERANRQWELRARRNQRRVEMDISDVESDDSSSSIPSLVERRGGFSSDTENSSSIRVVPVGTRQGSSSSSDESGIPSLVGRRGFSEDESDIPPLAGRQLIRQQAGDDASESDDDSYGPEPNGSNSVSSSGDYLDHEDVFLATGSSSTEEDVELSADSSNTQRLEQSTTVQTFPDDESSHEEPPVLRIRGSGPQAGSDSDSDSPPELADRNNNEDDSSDGTGSIPELVTRRGGFSSESDSDDEAPPSAFYRMNDQDENRQPNAGLANNTNRVLQEQETNFQPRAASFDNSSDNSSVPPLGGGDSSSEADAPASRRQANTPRFTNPPTNEERRAAPSRPSALGEWIERKKAEANSMDTVELMREVQAMQIVFPENRNSITREELVNMWSAKQAAREMPDSRPHSQVAPERLPELTPFKPPLVDGVWAITPLSASSSEIAFCHMDSSGKVQSLRQGLFAGNSRLISSYVNGRGAAWVAEKEPSEKKWRLSHWRPNFNRISMPWSYEEEFPTVDWVIDRNGESYITQIVSSESFRLIRVNAQYPKGEILKNNLKAPGKLYPAFSGVWLTNVHTDSNPSGHAEMVPHSFVFAAPFDVSEVRFCSNCDRETVIMLFADNESPNHSIMQECQPHAKEVRQRKIPVALDHIKDFCADGKNAVLFHCQMGGQQSYGLFRAEWRFEKKFERLQECSGRTTLVVDGTHGGVWLWKKANKGPNRILSYIDRQGNFSEEGARFPLKATVEGGFAP